jgi:putative membrane protein insertion efficiency factor
MNAGPAKSKLLSAITRFFRDYFSLLWMAPSRMIGVSIRFYQYAISPLFGPTCRFRPTCSEYFLLSVKKYGAIRGSWRGFRRIMRCHPWNPGGFDPP